MGYYKFVSYKDLIDALEDEHAIKWKEKPTIELSPKHEKIWKADLKSGDRVVSIPPTWVLNRLGPKDMVKGITVVGNGVTLYGAKVSFDRCKDLKILNLAVRLGCVGAEDEDDRDDALRVDESKYVHIEGCSVSWGSDENLCVTNSIHVKVLRCITSEALNNAKNSKGELLESGEKNHSYGMQFRGTRDVTLDGCVFVTTRGRNPNSSYKGAYGPQLRMVNCVVFNFLEVGVGFNGNKSKVDEEERAGTIHLENIFFTPQKAGEGDDPFAIRIDEWPKGHQLDVSVRNCVEHPSKEKVTVILQERLDKGKKKNVAVEEGTTLPRGRWSLSFPNVDTVLYPLDRDTIIKQAGAFITSGSKRERVPGDDRIVELALNWDGVAPLPPLIDSETETPEYDAYYK
jgi:hypothetical protein